MIPTRLRHLILAALLLATSGCSPAEPSALRVTIIGIDGASWGVMDPLLLRGELPNLAKLIEGGVRAQLRSERPLVSPPVWTSIATGVPRARHGIRGFVARKTRRLVSSTDRRVPALWTIASRGGLRSVVVGWWATYPAESINGVVVSDRTLKTRLKSVRRVTGENSLEDTQWDRLVHPPDAMQTLDALLTTPVPGGADLEDFDVQATMRVEDAIIARSVVRLRDSHGPFDLELLLLRGVDPVSHHYWQYHEPDAPVYAEAERPTAEEQSRIGDPVVDHYRYVDGLVGELLRGSGGERVVLVVSDHGFEAGHQGFRKGRKTLLGKHSSDAAALGIFIGAGGPFRRGVALAQASIFDIAPTVLQLLGLPISEELPGQVLTEALDPDWLSQHPARHIARYEGSPVDLTDPDVDSSSPGDEALREELRALGYIE